MQLLESKINEARSKKDMLKARAQSAKYASPHAVSRTSTLLCVSPMPASYHWTWIHASNVKKMHTFFGFFFFFFFLGVTNLSALGLFPTLATKLPILAAMLFRCRTSKYIQELVGSIDTSSALAAYERMEEKVVRLEAEAEALGDITEDNLATKVSFPVFELLSFWSLKF